MVFREEDLSALGKDDDKVEAAVNFINGLMEPDDEE
jgi:hypothetical protein